MSSPVGFVSRVGAGSIVTVQEAILAHWFKGKGLAVALGIQIACARLSSFLATGTVVPITRHFDFYGYGEIFLSSCLQIRFRLVMCLFFLCVSPAFWASAAICFFSWLVNGVYVAMLWYLGENRSKEMQDLGKTLSKKSRFDVRAVYSFPNAFWLIIFLSFAFGSCWAPFLTISPSVPSRLLCSPVVVGITQLTHTKQGTSLDELWK